MALTNAQIVTLALQISKTPGMASQAGMLYNAILEELAESFDYDIQKVTSFSILSKSISTNFGAGPYNLPSNYLRASPGEVNFVYNGQPYILTQYDMARWREQFQGAGIQDYPRKFATDFSTVETLGFPQAYLWPPPNGAYNILWPYFKTHTYIVNPQTDTNAPWFPMSTYLIRRLAGEMMMIANDDRAATFLSDKEGSGGAGDLMRRYLEMKDDKEGFAQQVKLDPNNFSSANFANLPNTKIVGW
jgi:hypothetical protein